MYLRYVSKRCLFFAALEVFCGSSSPAAAEKSLDKEEERPQQKRNAARAFSPLSVMRWKKKRKQGLPPHCNVIEVPFSQILEDDESNEGCLRSIKGACKLNRSIT